MCSLYWWYKVEEMIISYLFLRDFAQNSLRLNRKRSYYAEGSQPQCPPICEQAFRWVKLYVDLIYIM